MIIYVMVLRQHRQLVAAAVVARLSPDVLLPPHVPQLSLFKNEAFGSSALCTNLLCRGI